MASYDVTSTIDKSLGGGGFSLVYRAFWKVGTDR